jgi:hypothetical protein
MKRKIFTLLVSACFATMAMAQAPNVIIKKAAVAPVLDGVVDDVWAAASKQNIDKPFQAETPTLGEPGQTTWQALWNDDGIFILLQVTDDEFYPAYMNNNDADWKYDKPEIYFDVNAEKKDGKGPGTSGSGHWQFAPGFAEATIDGTLIDDGTSGMHAFKVTAPNYKAEYFIPFAKLKDKDGSDVDITQPMGFDVTIIDGESAAPGIRQRAVWTNDGKGPGANESYNNMDDCGTITLSSFDGGIIAKATAPPVLDGVVDDVWAGATAYNIDKPFKGETPTLGEPGTTTWQALWNDDGIFVLLKVTDDEFYPAYMNNNDADWKYDKPEIYFDTNAIKKDGLGGHENGGNKGHYQIAPGFLEAEIDGTIHDDGANGMHAFKVTAPNYVAEYFIPFSHLVDQNGVEVDKSIPMGFDVTIIDGDSANPGVRQRMVWMNDTNGPAASESYNNMDDCGLVMFDGAVMASDVTDITVSGGTAITTDNGTLQMVATVEPSDANQNVKWVVENGTGRATISAKGLLTAVVNGTVLVKAVAKDGTDVEGKITVTISGQKVTMNEINYVLNGNFDNVTATGAPVDWNNGTVTDGVLNFGPATVLTNQWDYSVLQVTHIPFELKDQDFVISLKAWADEPRTLPLVFEDATADGNQWDSYIASSNPDFSGKTWAPNLTTEPQIFSMVFNFSAMQETTVQNMNFQVGLSAAQVHVDSIYLVSQADLALVTSARTLSNVNKVKLYPNPVQTELTISKISVANSKVSVYNSLGQKLMEKTANGTQAKFDVANLRKGMYFVRFSDGTSEKFIKQ